MRIPRVLLDADDGGLGAEAGVDRLADTPQPAGIGGEHAEGLQHVVGLRRPGAARTRREAVEAGAQRRDGGGEARALGLRVVGDEAARRRARADHRHPPPGEAAGEGLALDQPGAALRRQPFGRGHQLAAGGQFGDRHADDLERLQLLVAVAARRAVLHRQHADDAAVAQERDAHERLVDVLARLGPVGEQRMGAGRRRG